eukprot:jgi/Chrpa1/699/Chrysochromulina_OHIO_Genome00012247-RA
MPPSTSASTSSPPRGLEGGDLPCELPPRRSSRGAPPREPPLREKALETARSGGVAMESSPSKIEERGAVHWLRREARASSDPPHGLPQPLAPMSHNDGSRSGDAGAAAHAAAAVALAARSSSGWRSRSGGRAGGCARLRDGDCGGRDGGGRKESSGWLAVSHAVRLLDDVEELVARTAAVALYATSGGEGRRPRPLSQPPPRSPPHLSSSCSSSSSAESSTPSEWPPSLELRADALPESLHASSAAAHTMPLEPRKSCTSRVSTSHAIVYAACSVSPSSPPSLSPPSSPPPSPPPPSPPPPSSPPPLRSPLNTPDGPAPRASERATRIGRGGSESCWKAVSPR